MQTFYVVIKKEVLIIYEKDGDSFERVYLGGNPEYSYSVNCSQEHINKLFECLIEEYNLDTIGEVDFIVVENEDQIVSKSVVNALGQSVKNLINIEGLMIKISEGIGRDKKLRIREYGINFDGKRYLFEDEKISKEDFCLLSYSLSDDMLMQFVG